MRASHSKVGLTMAAMALAFVAGASQPTPKTCLGIVAQNLARGTDNFYGYYQFSNKRLFFKKGDVLVYDVYLDPRDPELKGGIDIDLNGAVSMREHDFVDQNGIRAHGDGILTPARAHWYTRRIVLDTLPGLQAVSWNLVFEGDAYGRYAQFVDDVHIERADGSRVDIYEGGTPQFHEDVLLNGYSSQALIADVPKVDVRPGNEAQAEAEVETIGARLNELSAMTQGTELVRAATSGANGLEQALREAESAAHGSDAQFKSAMAALKTRFQAMSGLLKSFQGDMVGYAHTDVEWLWEWPEARLAVYQTWRQALKFMDQYPDFSSARAPRATTRRWRTAILSCSKTSKSA